MSAQLDFFDTPSPLPAGLKYQADLLSPAEQSGLIDRIQDLPFKNFEFKERSKGQFRAETLNAFNTPYFYSPTTNFSSGSFGQITSQANFARQLQLAIRVSF